MGSLRAKQGSYIEILKAIQLGQLQGLTRPDRLLASQIWNTLNKMEYDPDLKLYLPFDEASGATAHDLSGNGNTGTAEGATITDGVFGKCRSFDGDNDYVSVPNGIISLKTFPWTISMWINPALADDAYFFSAYQNNYSYNRGGLYITSDGILYAGINYGASGGTSFGVNGVTAVSLNSWHFCALSVENSLASFYVDGVLRDTNTAFAVGTEVIEVFTLGANLDQPITHFTGFIDEPRFYLRTLSADEMYLHYLAGALKLGLI